MLNSEAVSSLFENWFWHKSGIFFFGGAVINFNCLIGQLKGFGGVRMECHILSLGKMINGRNSSDETATAPCGIIATHNFLQ